MVQAVARVHGSLPPADRTRAGIYTENYGEAGAVDFFGPRFGLPGAISAHRLTSTGVPGNTPGTY